MAAPSALLPRPFSYGRFFTWVPAQKPLALLNKRSNRSSFAPVARLFDPEEFDPSKLTVAFQDGANGIKNLPNLRNLLPRTYTLTHSDFTKELLLTIGPSHNKEQLAGWYTRLMRDEIVAEWRGNGVLSLHIHCHISGGNPLLAPASLRNKIFKREMPLVLRAIRHGDRELLMQHPELDRSIVWVHYHSTEEEYARADCWGSLLSAAAARPEPYSSQLLSLSSLQI